MKITIIYDTHHGTTAKVAELLQRELGTLGTAAGLHELESGLPVAVSDHELLILGTSIHAGMPGGKMKKFVSANLGELTGKKIALFICGMEPEGARRNTEMEVAFPRELKEKAIAYGFLGGEFIFEKMNFIEKVVIRKIAKTSESVSQIDVDAIRRFALEVQKAL